MNLEDRYNASKDVIKPTRYDLGSKLSGTVNVSKYNIDSIPSKYDTISKLQGTVNVSKYNIDSTPTKYHG
jgi:hypothetical protein